MKTIKIIYHFVAILVLIIIGIDTLQNMKLSLEDILFPIFSIIVAIICLFPFIMTVWEEYQDYKQNKNKNE